tara:strand:+ start:486 stop:824 length:339 start_codon:yes stop_codon:yes gene_type:complete
VDQKSTDGSVNGIVERMQSINSVMIAGHRVKITRGQLEDCYGEYSHERRTIQLSDKLLAKDYLPTLRHEMLHASFHLAGISFLESFQEEACVRCVDEIFFPAYERLLKRLQK